MGCCRYASLYSTFDPALGVSHTGDPPSTTTLTIDYTSFPLIRNCSTLTHPTSSTIQGNATVGHALHVGTGGIRAAAGGIRILDGGFEAHTSSRTTDTNGNEPSSLSRVQDRWPGEGGRGGTEADPAIAVGLLSASHPQFSGNVLRVDAGGAGSAEAGAVLIRATAGGEDVFELKVNAEFSSLSYGK